MVLPCLERDTTPGSLPNVITCYHAQDLSEKNFSYKSVHNFLNNPAYKPTQTNQTNHITSLEEVMTFLWLHLYFVAVCSLPSKRRENGLSSF